MSDQDPAVGQEPTVDQEEVAADEAEHSEEEVEVSEEEAAKAKLKEVVLVEKEDIGALRIKMTVTIPRDTLDERMGDQFAELKRDAMVPGFRKGHAPLVLVEKRFGADVGDQLLSQMLSQGFMAAAEKEELKTLGDPMFWVKTQEERLGEDGKPRTVEADKLLAFEEALEHLKFPKTGPMTFSCEVELRPDFELPNLEKIPLKVPKLSIEDKDVEDELTRMRRIRGRFEPVEGGVIEEDDLLYADMKMIVDGAVIADERNVDIAARDVRMQGIQLEGFGEAVLGKKAGAVVTHEATIPDDHENIDLRGKTAGFEFTINEIKRMEIPPFDQAFLSRVGFETEKELQDAVRATLESRLDDAIKNGMRERMGRYLIENTKMEVPEGLSQRQTQRSIDRRRLEMLQAGVPESELNKVADELLVRAHDQVVDDLKLFFVLERIAEDREVKVSEERINGAIAQIAQRANKRFDRVRDELSKGDGLVSLYVQIRDQQILDSLLEDAAITEEEGPKKKAAKKPKAKKKKTKSTKA